MRRLALLISAVVILSCGVKADAATISAILSTELSGEAPTAELAATGLFDSVDWIDVGILGSTPTLAALENYDSLLVYSSMPFIDRDALSGVLKDYVDGGGHVVLAAYCFTDNEFLDYAIGAAGSGAGILTAGYAPLKPVAHTASDPTSGDIHALSPGDPIFDNITIGAGSMLSDFNYFHNTSFNNPVLDSGADLLADDGDGTNMIARNAAGNVVALNLFPQDNSSNSGQFYQLVANAMQPVPEPATSIVWVLLGFGLAVAARRRSFLPRFTQR